MEIYKKLLSVQTKLKAPKSQYNSFGKYSYRNCEDILEALKPLLAETECTLFIRDEIEIHGENTYITAHASFVDCGTGDIIEVKASAREEQTKKGMDASQITGSTSSYARKYALNGLFCIDDTKDADEQKTEADTRSEKSTTSRTAVQKKTTAKSKESGQCETSKEERISDVDISVLRDYLADNGISEEKVLKKYSYQSLREMPCRIFKNITNPSSLNFFRQKCGVDA